MDMVERRMESCSSEPGWQWHHGQEVMGREGITEGPAQLDNWQNVGVRKREDFKNKRDLTRMVGRRFLRAKQPEITARKCHHNRIS